VRTITSVGEAETAMDYLRIARKALDRRSAGEDRCGELQDSVSSEADPKELTRAGRVLSAAGVRLIEIDGELIVGLWSDLDSLAVRQALHLFGSGELPIRYLDEAVFRTVTNCAGSPGNRCR
jgi:hypothetical protein